MARNIVVSGASRGIGLCIAQQHTAKGDTVHIIARTLTPQVRELAEQHPNCVLHQGDVSDTGKLTPALQEIIAAIPHIDILYNVAAIFFEEDRKGLADLDIDRIPEMVNTNACGALRVLKGLAPIIDEHTTILNISSEAACIGTTEEVALYSYTMSKAALNIATKVYHNEHGKKRNAVVVCPGWVRTDMGGPAADLAPEYSAEKLVELAENLDKQDPDSLFFKYDGRALPW